MVGFLLLLSLSQTRAALEVSAPPAYTALVPNATVLTCTFWVEEPVLSLDLLSVFWWFQEKVLVKYEKQSVFSSDPRMSLRVEALWAGDASLYISNVRLSDGGIYTCSIAYTTEQIQKEFPLNVQARPLLPLLSKNFLQEETLDSLTCLVTGFFPPDITITWLKDGDVLNDYVTEKPEKDKDGTYKVTSTLSITVPRIIESKTFSCRVQHASLPQPIQRDIQLVIHLGVRSIIVIVSSVILFLSVIGLCWLQIKTDYGIPVMEEIKVPRLFQDIPTTLRCHISEYFPGDIAVTWLRRNSENEELVEEAENLISRTVSRRQTRKNNTYSCTASLTITPKLHIHQGATYICRVEHPSLDKPIEKSTGQLQVSDYPWIPVMEEIQVPRLFHDIPTTLQCHISGYFPGDIAVTWLRRNAENEELVEEAEALVSRRQRRKNKTYSCTARLTITPKLHVHQGATYICRVEHPSLDNPIEKSTGQLQVSGRPQMAAPIEITMSHNSSVRFSLSLQTFYPKDITVLWRYEDGESKHPFHITPTNTFTANHDLTYDVTSIAETSVHAFSDLQFRVHVTWNHPSMDEEESRTFSVDLPWRPCVGDIIIPNKKEKKSATL